MMKKTFLIACLLALANAANTCTTFFLQRNGQMVFGRNYDWMADAGMVCTNQRGLTKTSIKNPDGNTISWVSIFGSVTFNQYGKEFPPGV
jgi:penicillin V acylase-like amidase (Ntn superfamily)